MAFSDVVLGLVVDRPDRRRSLVRRYREDFADGELIRRLDEFNPFDRGEDGELRATPVSKTTAEVHASIASNVDAALAWLLEHALIEPTAERGAPKGRRARERVYAATPAGIAHFERWMADASTLDPQGRELRSRVLFSKERQLPRLRELVELQELLCFERLEELRHKGERMTFAHCSTLEELWEAMTALNEPMHLQSTVEWVRNMRQLIDETLERGLAQPPQDGDAPAGRSARAVGSAQ